MKTNDFKKQVNELRDDFLTKKETFGTFNKYLIFLYEEQTGHTVFKTFKAWLAEGYRVRKGESSFPLFSRPLTALQLEKGKEPDMNHSKHFFTCHLFHDGQVDSIKKS